MQTVEEKIAQVIERVKSLKEDKDLLERRNRELEETLQSKDREIERLAAEKMSIKGQIEDLLRELETLEIK